MMKKKHIELIKYLLNQNNDVTSAMLGIQLQTSSRTIKNYVNEINLISGETIVLSSKTGYRINRLAAEKLFSKNEEKIPQNSEERVYYILKKLLIEHTSHLNIYDLCDELFVGYSTLKADIYKMNKSFQAFNVEFSCENEEVCIIGDEKNKRKLISYIIQEETSSTFLNTDIIKNSFSNIDIDLITEIIITTFRKYNYYINDFSFINLILHFSIVVDRIRDGKFVKNHKEKFIIENEIEKALVDELSKRLENAFSIHFDANEQFEIYMLFKSNANYSLPSNEEHFRKLVGDEIVDYTKRIVEKVSEDYYVDLNSESFLTPFALHLKNLLLRLQNNTSIKNPMVESIKNSCPTIYDISIYISLLIMNHYQVTINEDEVTFLALHVGAEIERQKSNDSKIQVIILCPDYMNMAAQTYNQLLIEFGNKINILKVVNNEQALTNCNFDLLMTTIHIQYCHVESILIPPFLTNNDKRQIYELIEKINENKKNQILITNFHYFFTESLFLANPHEYERDSIIEKLSTKMVKKGYVHHDFMEKVLIRERAASTAFVNIAIPHSVEMDAMKTCVSVAISKKGIRWDSHIVHVVLCVAINAADKRTFHELYEALVVLFSNESVMNMAKLCNTFQDFEKLIYQAISYQSK